MKGHVWVGLWAAWLPLCGAGGANGQPRYYGPCRPPAVPVYTSPSSAPRIPAQPPASISFPYSRDYAPPVSPTLPATRPVPRMPPASESIESSPAASRGPAPAATYYDIYQVVSSTMPPASPGGEDLREVSFWNLSEQPLTLQVNGQTYSLRRHQQVKLALPRKFNWHVGNRDPVTTSVPADRQGLDIVIRR